LRSFEIQPGPTGTVARTFQGRGGRSAAVVAKAVAPSMRLWRPVARLLRTGAADKGRRGVCASVS